MSEKLKILHLDDQGQDFTRWVIDETGLIVDAGPFQSSVWSGCIVDLDSVFEHDCPVFTSKQGDRLQLNYAILEIEEISKTDYEQRYYKG